MQPGEEEQLIQILVNGFMNDPISILCDTDPELRRNSLTKMFSDMIINNNSNGKYLVETTNDLSGVAIWKHTREPDPETNAATDDMPTQAAKLFQWVAGNSPPAPYWYLAFIAARVKGKGVGTALIRHRLDAISRPSGEKGKEKGEKVVALWTGNKDNVGLYGGEKLGFRVWRERRVGEVSDAWWMIRNL